MSEWREQRRTDPEYVPEIRRAGKQWEWRAFPMSPLYDTDAGVSRTRRDAVRQARRRCEYLNAYYAELNRPIQVREWERVDL